MTFLPSPQQTSIFSWIANGAGNGMIVAVAGAGKTTTLVKALALTKGTVTFCAFNKAAAEDIQLKSDKEDRSLRSRVFCGTFHSLGFSALRTARGQMILDQRKRRDDLTGQVEALLRRQGGKITRVPSKAWDLFDLARQRAIDPRTASPEDYQAIIEHFDLNQPSREERLAGITFRDEDLVRIAHMLLTRAIDEDNTVIDFSDMIYLPVVMGYQPKRSDWVFVDECQDTNPARRRLAEMALKPGGRFVAVGDPSQAIYGFTGADSDSMDLIAKAFSTSSMELTVTYRCPKAVVKVAQQWVSHIEAHESAPEGEVVTIDRAEVLGMVEKGDAILCRKTAPIVELAFNLIRQGKRAHVEGRDIGRGLIALTEKFKTDDVGRFFSKLRDWAQVERESLIKKGRNLAADALDDKVATLEVLGEDCGTVTEIRSKIEQIFDDSKPNEAQYRITLATIHRAKGREWNTVYWLGHAEYSPSPMARQPWEFQQEDNLCYVAATRAKSKLVLVD